MKNFLKLAGMMAVAGGVMLNDEGMENKIFVKLGTDIIDIASHIKADAPIYVRLEDLKNNKQQVVNAFESMFIRYASENYSHVEADIIAKWCSLMAKRLT